MPERKETKKYTFTVEGETEKWYLDWLAEQINGCEEAKYKVSIVAQVQQNPSKFAKSQARFSTPAITHICDVESNEPEHVKKFTDILDQIDKANKLGKKIKYSLGYSNFTFELWMILHKRDCCGPLDDRSQYLAPICQCFGEDFEDLDHYKQKAAFLRCLGKLSLEDVKSAVGRAKQLAAQNERDGNGIIKYSGYSYYRENPALSINEVVERILRDCGVL